MKKVPCILCKKTWEVSNKDVIAVICPDCDESKPHIIKDLTYKKVKELLEGIKAIKPISKIKTNEFGEII